MKLQEIRENIYCLYLPTAIVKGLQWKKGDDIEVTIGGKNKIELSKKD